MSGNHKAIADLSVEQQAEKALRHLLTRIRDHAFVGYYCGYGTETFALATEALAALTNRSVEAIAEEFAPLHPRNPVQVAEEQIAEDCPLSEDDVAMLTEVAAHHGTMHEMIRAEANKATHQTGYELHMLADKHSTWSDELSALAEAKGGR